MSSGRKTVPSPVMAIFIGKHTFPGGGQSTVNKISFKSGKFFTFIVRNSEFGPSDQLVFGLLQSKFAGFGNTFCSQYTMDDVIVMQ